MIIENYSGSTPPSPATAADFLWDGSSGNYGGASNATCPQTPKPTSDPTQLTLDPTDAPSKSATGAPDQLDSPSESPTLEPTIDPTMEPTFDEVGIIDEPTARPTQSPIRETIADITINVTISDPNLSEEEVIANVNRSVKQYFNDTLKVDVGYLLIVQIVGNKTVARIVVFDVYVLDTDDIGDQINGDELQDKIQKDLTDNYGDDTVIVVVIVHEKDFSKLNEQQTLFQQITMLIAVGLILMICASFADAKWIRKNDFHKVGSLFSASFHILDTWSDVFFAIQCTFHPDFELSFSSPLFIIFLLSIIFIVIPMSATLYQLNHITNKHWNKRDDLRGWLSDYVYQLYMMSILCGSSFAAVSLFRSNLFNLSAFDIPLSKQEALHFNTKKVYSTILLEVNSLINALFFSDFINRV